MVKAKSKFKLQKKVKRVFHIKNSSKKNDYIDMIFWAVKNPNDSFNYYKVYDKGWIKPILKPSKYLLRLQVLYSCEILEVKNEA